METNRASIHGVNLTVISFGCDGERLCRQHAVGPVIGAVSGGVDVGDENVVCSLELEAIK